MDGVKGLDDEIPASMVVSKQSYVATNVNIAPQVAALRASGAQVVVSFSIPAFTALLKLNSLKLGFNPHAGGQRRRLRPDHAVRAARGVREAGRRRRSTATSSPTGSSPTSYLPALTASDSWYTLFKMVHDQYDPKAPLDGNFFYGMAVGYTFVQAMLKAGRNPTRASLVSAIEGGLPQGPMVAPFAYAAGNHLGATGAYMGVIQNGVVVQQGSVLTTDTSASGPITTYSGTEQQAPASGIPSP